MSVSLDSMKAITRRFAIEPWENGNVSVLDEVCAPDYVIGEDGNLQNLKDAIVAFRHAIPDLKLSLYEMIAEGDTVAYRWTMQGTHQGEYHGIAPTGKPVTFNGITIVRFANGKIVNDQFESGSPSLEQQVV
jgi:predicted ester cyclase